MSNVSVTPGTGKAVATETIAAVEYQQIKLLDATVGSTAPIGTSANPLPVVQTGAAALPTGASTAANQATGNTSLATIATNIPVQGQALSAASMPVVLPAVQVTALTPPAAITGFATATAQTSGNSSLTSIDGKTPALGQALAAASVPVILPAATITTLTPPTAVGLNAGTNLIGKVSTDQTTHGTTDLVAADITKLAGTAIVNGGLAGSQAIGGTGAAAAAITQNPLNLGAKGVSAEPTAVTAGQLSQLVTDLVGKLIVLPYAVPQNFVSGVTAAMTATTSTSLVAAPAAGARNYVTHIIVTNSHATVGTFVNIQDGTGGTTVYSGYAAPAGGGFSITFPTPLKQPTLATALFCANVTTGANVVVSASGYVGA